MHLNIHTHTHTHIYIYIYIVSWLTVDKGNNQSIGKVVRVFTNGRGDWGSISGQVKPNT